VKISIIDGLSVDVPLRGGENLLAKSSRQVLARDRNGVSVSPNESTRWSELVVGEKTGRRG
jgi:hypothetical protein